MPAAATPRAAPRKVITEPAPAAQAMPMNRPLPNLVGWSDSLYREWMATSSGKDGRGHGGMGHEQGHAADDQKGAQEDEIGFLAHDIEHLVGHALGEARRR